jgi:hypothetical protein
MAKKPEENMKMYLSMASVYSESHSVNERRKQAQQMK